MRLNLKMNDYNKFPSRKSGWPGYLLILWVFLGFAGCTQTETEENGVEKRELSLPVQIGRVIFKDVVDEIRAVGNIVAEQRVIITSEVEGRIRKVKVEEGTSVKAGAVLAEIDTRQYRLEVERLQADQISARKEYEKTFRGLRPEDQEKLQAQMKADQSGRDLALKEQKRIERLVFDGVISQSLLDEANDKVRQAEEKLRSSQAALAAGTQSREEDILKSQSDLNSVTKKLALAKLSLSKARIRAPFDGVIVSKKIEVGAYAAPGTPILEMISSLRLKAVLELPQSYRNKLEKLTEIEFYVQDLGLGFKVSENLDRQVRVIPDANIFSGNVQVQVNLPDPNPALFPGLTLEGRLRFDTRPGVKHVPAIALVIGEQGTVVYIMKDGHAQLVPVRASKERENLVEIDDFTHQLMPETDLILRGSGAVFPGVEVFPTNPEPQSETPFNAADKGKGEKRVEKPKT